MPAQKRKREDSSDSETDVDSQGFQRISPEFGTNLKLEQLTYAIRRTPMGVLRKGMLFDLVKELKHHFNKERKEQKKMREQLVEQGKVIDGLLGELEATEAKRRRLQEQVSEMMTLCCFQ